MNEPTPRQVLYALVAGGFVLVVLMLVISAAAIGAAPTWFTVSLGSLTVVSSIWMALNWRKTGPVLMIAIGLFVIWLVGTLSVVL